jgi:hypothetical protein
VAATLDQISAEDGPVEALRLVVLGLVILGLYRDPAGNRIGLVEIDKRGQAIVR